MFTRLVEHVFNSFNLAHSFITKLDKWRIAINPHTKNHHYSSGMKTRALCNEICSIRYPDRNTRYLHVGEYDPSISVFASALSCNYDCLGTMIVNQEFDEKLCFEEELLSRMNFIRKSPLTIDTSTIENQFDFINIRSEDISEYGKILVHYWPVMRNEMIIIVDNWNFSIIRQQIYDSLREMNANIIQSFKIQHTDAPNQPTNNYIEFFNGIAVFIVKKP